MYRNAIVKLKDHPAVAKNPDLCPGLHGQLLWVFVGKGEAIVLIGRTAWRLPVQAMRVAHAVDDERNPEPGIRPNQSGVGIPHSPSAYRPIA